MLETVLEQGPAGKTKTAGVHRRKQAEETFHSREQSISSQNLTVSLLSGMICETLGNFFHLPAQTVRPM